MGLQTTNYIEGFPRALNLIGRLEKEPQLDDYPSATN
jgi:hypothetical protein